jgi:hypothetical protein
MEASQKELSYESAQQGPIDIAILTKLMIGEKRCFLKYHDESRRLISNSPVYLGPELIALRRRQHL